MEKKHCNCHKKKQDCEDLPQPPITPITFFTSDPLFLDGQNCVCCNDEKNVCAGRHNVNKYIDCQSYPDMCKNFNTPLDGYADFSPLDPALYIFADPAGEPVQPGQKGIWPVPESPFLDITGKNVLVVGASRGFGKVIAEMFVEKGCNVYGTSRHPECYTNSFQKGHLLKLDVRFTKKVDKFFYKLMSKYFTNGKIDYVINCPGIQWLGELQHSNGDDLTDQFNLQVGGYQRIVKNALPYMKHDNSTRIVSFGSIAGEIALNGGYSIGKRALQFWNDIHMQEARIRIASGRSMAEPSFVLVEPGAFLTNISLYERYKAACAEKSDPHIRGTQFGINTFQNMPVGLIPQIPTLGADPNLAYVAQSIYDIVIAPQPSLRYLLDQTDFSVLISQIGNILSADDTMNFIQSEIFAALGSSEDVLNAFRELLAELYGCAKNKEWKNRNENTRTIINDSRADLIKKLKEVIQKALEK